MSIAIIAAALITGLIVVHETNKYPRTDDAEVFANFIGIAPQVDGPIIQLAVQDNAFIEQGELLFQIDPRPYEYALREGQIRPGHAGGPDHRPDAERSPRR